MQAEIEIPMFLRVMGVVAYSMFTVLAITWGGIALDRARRIARDYYLLVVACVCAAIFAANLALIATDPVWISRLVLTVINRFSGMIGVIALATYTIAVLRAEYRRDQTRRHHDDLSSHSKTLTAL